MSDQLPNITPETFRQLSTLRSEPKFHKAWKRFYPGAPTEEIRLSTQRTVDDMLDRLQAGLQATPRKSYVLGEFLEMLKGFEHADTEEREEACTYCERVMKIVGIQSSDGLLNAWLYRLGPEQRS
jgi:hypothetical protein